MRCHKCGENIDYVFTYFEDDDTGTITGCITMLDEAEGGIELKVSRAWRGYGQDIARQQDSLQCPCCGQFPFTGTLIVEEPVIIKIAKEA